MKRPAITDVEPGLCGRCRHCHMIAARSSTYYLCRRSVQDSAYPRYPRLPVRVCPGFEPAEGANEVGRPVGSR